MKIINLVYLFVLVNICSIQNSYASFSSTCRGSSDNYDCCLGYSHGYKDALNDLAGILSYNNDFMQFYANHINQNPCIPPNSFQKKAPLNNPNKMPPLKKNINITPKK